MIANPKHDARLSDGQTLTGIHHNEIVRNHGPSGKLRTPAIECVFECKGAPISNVPRPLRKALTAEGYQRWRGVNAIYRETSIGEISRYRLARTAANVEYCCAL
jgi:hypothetical protein